MKASVFSIRLRLQKTQTKQKPLAGLLVEAMAMASKPSITVVFLLASSRDTRQSAPTPKRRSCIGHRGEVAVHQKAPKNALRQSLRSVKNIIAQFFLGVNCFCARFLWTEPNGARRGAIAAGWRNGQSEQQTRGVSGEPADKAHARGDAGCAQHHHCDGDSASHFSAPMHEALFRVIGVRRRLRLGVGGFLHGS